MRSTVIHIFEKGKTGSICNQINNLKPLKSEKTHASDKMCKRCKSVVSGRKKKEAKI